VLADKVPIRIGMDDLASAVLVEFRE